MIRSSQGSLRSFVARNVGYDFSVLKNIVIEVKFQGKFPEDLPFRLSAHFSQYSAKYVCS